MARSLTAGWRSSRVSGAAAAGDGSAGTAPGIRTAAPQISRARAFRRNMQNLRGTRAAVQGIGAGLYLTGGRPEGQISRVPQENGTGLALDPGAHCVTERPVQLEKLRSRSMTRTSRLAACLLVLFAG